MIWKIQDCKYVEVELTAKEIKRLSEGQIICKKNNGRDSEEGIIYIYNCDKWIDDED